MNKISSGQSDLKVDSDIKSTVKDYLRDYNNNTDDVTVPEDVSQWFCVQIQLERDRWLEKIKVALQEIEVQRRIALNSHKFMQDSVDHLYILLQNFDVSEEVLSEIPQNELEIALPKCTEILMNICQKCMEERYQCQEILGIEQNGANLAAVLKQTIKDLVNEANPPITENGNKHLYEELSELKHLLHQKQKDVASLQKQLEAINYVIEDRTDHNSDEKAKSDASSMSELYLPKPKVKFADEYQKPSAPQEVFIVDKTYKPPTLTKLTVGPFEIVPSITKLDTRESRLDRPYSEKSVASNSSRGQGQQTEKLFTLETQTQTMHEKSYIHLSEEKLKTLKIQAKKLETSLHDAISSMNKFNKKCHVGDQTISNTSTSSNLSNALVRISRRGDYSTRRLVEDLKVASWKKVPFEVQGSQSNLPRSRRPKRSVSEGRRPDVQPETENYEHTSNVGHLSQRSVKRHAPVAKCLRCQKLFRRIDNHKLACCYHPKPKERFEKYNNSGQLLRVMYVWQCCRQEVEADGCTFGQHV